MKSKPATLQDIVTPQKKILMLKVTNKNEASNYLSWNELLTLMNRLIIFI